MTRQWKYLVVMLIMGWFLGAASGLLIMRFCHPGPGHMQKRFAHKLHLTQEQQTQVDTILKTSHQKMDQIYGETRSRLEQVREETRTQIRQILNPDQQVIFDKLHSQSEERFKKKMDFFQGKHS